MDNIEKQLSQAAKYLEYPPTPDITTRKPWSNESPRPLTFQRRSLAWAMMVFLVVVVSLLSVPSVRAQLIEFLQIGGVRILLPEPTATDADNDIAAPTIQTATPLATQPAPGQDLVISVLDLDGATSLAEAKQKVEFPIQLPSYPGSLGEPDHVFVSDIGTGLYVVLAWTTSGEPERAGISLHILSPGARLTKGPPDVIEETEVNGQPAAFVEGIYLLSVDGNVNPVRLVTGPVLVWELDGLTYRLEAELPRSEMLLIAESLQP